MNNTETGSDAVAYFVILLSWLVVFIGGVVVGRA